VRPSEDSEDQDRDGAQPFPPATSESVSLEIVRRIRAGERGAWDELYARYHDQLLLAVRVRLGPGLRRYLESEDIFQSVALEALRALERFEYRGEGSLERYLHTLVVNKIRDRADTFRAQKRAGSIALDDELAEGLPAGGPGYNDAPRYEQLERALNALPPEQRELIVLRKLENLSSQEVAARLGLSDDAARKAYSRALARLTTVLTSFGPA
jgi:RNA polymerase sigma-70 factor (ECF subfamily)